MFTKKFVSRAAGASLAAFVLLTAQPLRAAISSETARLEKLERAVEMLEKQNAELRAEINSLKGRQAAYPPEGKLKKKVIYDGKTYVEKAVVEEEKAPVYVQQRGPELKLVLGGFIQANFEDGDVSAFEGRFGQTALKDRFRLRRARINLTGDFAEQFDFKIEGEFESSDGLNSSRTAFEGTDIFVNWHQFPWAQVKVGQWKAPFGLEQTTPDTSLYIIERSLPTGAITPERQTGALLGAHARERFRHELNAELLLRRDRARRQAALDDIQGSVRRGLLQAKWRFPLADFDLRPGKLMPVDENIGALERCAARVKSVALLKVAFDLEVELLRKFAGEIDSCPA